MEKLRKIEELRKEIIMHENRYNSGKPVISDAEFDEKYNLLLALEKDVEVDKDSPTQKIVGEKLTGFKKVTHKTPLLSQSKINSTQEAIDFLLKQNEDMTLEDKLDGLTICLDYEKGVLLKAVTRGDGYAGYDLYETVKMIDNLPKKLKEEIDISIRAEIITPLSAFEKANEFGEFSNARNFAVGTVRQFDPSIVSGRGLKVITFEILESEKSFESGKEQLDYLKDLSFNVVNHSFIRKGEKEVLEKKIIEITKKRSSLDYEIDGLVLKINNLKKREELGSTSKHPRWSTAYKFEAAEKNTKLLDVTHSVGKSGRVTPVAVLDKVTISNVDITAATLHNYADIKKKGIKIGDIVVVKRANDVIPQVVSPIRDLRTGNERDVEMPSICPSCKNELEIINDMPYCRNDKCIPQIKGKIEHFASRDALDISGLGEQTVSELVDKGIISSVLDLLALDEKREEILKIDKMGKKKFENILKGIEDAKEKSLSRLIYSMSIENIGRTASRALEKEFSLTELIELDLEEIRKRAIEIEDFGGIMVSALCDFLAKNRELLNIFKNAGFAKEMKNPENIENENSSLKGMSFAVTGSFDIGRKVLEEKIRDMGGKVGSVSKNTSYLINNDKESNSSKNKKAKELGVTILNEEDFIEMFLK